MEKEYVLRERDDDEIYRLEFQHQVWKETSDLAIEKANIHNNDNIIDLGSGPGYLSYDIVGLLGDKGKLFCVDNSDKFIEFINRKNYKNIKATNLDIRKGLYEHFKNKQIDKIFCRWVLMFNDQIDKIIQEIYCTLSSGGKFISIEYFNFQQIDIFPKSSIFNKIYQKVETLLTKNGGDPNIGEHMFNILKEKGFKNIKTYPIYRKGKVNSPLWKWLEKTNENHINLVKSGLISQADLDLYMLDWKDKSKNDLSFITAPPLMITIGEK
jgi:ubiquinone/menaquinone biosynthesis C-methylase UbiE